jgi:DNA polymerase-1
MFCDIETQALYVGTRMVQVYQPDVDEHIWLLDTDIISEDSIKEFLKPFHTVWYGCNYDFGTLNMTTAKFDDLLYACRTAYPEWQEYPLNVAINKLGYDHLYAGLDKKAMQKQGFIKGAYLSDAQLRYCATDVYALSLMWQDKKIQNVVQNNLAYKVDIMSMEYAIQYQQNGIPVDQHLVREALDSLTDTIANNYVMLNGLNPNSPLQCKNALGTTSTDKNTLIKLINKGNKLAKLIYDQRRLLKRKGMLESYNYPRVYTRYNVAGAGTGRFTATGGDIERGINAQQIPRDLQHMFRSTNGKTVVIEADYSTLELRLACAIFNEPNMYKQLKDGEDLHTSMAQSVSGKQDIDKDERIKAKAINFGFVFGMSAPSFQEYAFVNFGVTTTDEEAKYTRDKYFIKYPSIGKYHKYVWNEVKKGSYVYETALGRRVKPKLGTDGINGPVQGSGAETTKLAVHYMVKETNGACLKYIINVVHDAIYLEVPIEEEEYWTEMLEKCMLKGWTEISKTDLFKFKDIPMIAEVKRV